MAQVVAGLFTDSKHAGMAVSELKEKGYTEEISVIAKDAGEDPNVHQIKQDVTEGAATGAVTGGVLGGLAGLLAGLTSVVVPGIGTLIVAGPWVIAWGLTGGAVGALGGGILGALVDAGIPDEKARMYEEHILAGEVLVAVTVPDDKVNEVQLILDKYRVVDTDTTEDTV